MGNTYTKIIFYSYFDWVYIVPYRIVDTLLDIIQGQGIQHELGDLFQLYLGFREDNMWDFYRKDGRYYSHMCRFIDAFCMLLK